MFLDGNLYSFSKYITPKIPREKQNIGREGGIKMSWMEKVLETTYICVFTGPH